VVEFLKDWQGFRAGAVSDRLTPGVADTLAKRGIVREVAAELPAEKPRPAAPKRRR
jgi:hypothetical protein